MAASSPKLVKCSNIDCSNDAAIADQICGALIQIGDEQFSCDYVTFDEPRKLCTFQFSFSLSSPTAQTIIAGLNDEVDGFYHEMAWELSGCEKYDYEAPSFTLLGDAIQNSLHRNEELNFDSTVDKDFYRINWCYLEASNEDLELTLEIELFSKSIPVDWLSWGPNALAEMFEDDELIWLDLDDQRIFAQNVMALD